jgi:spore maturation protein CgeB
MKFVIFGLSVSSSWGNGHATLWRGLCRALIARRHQVVFFERDLPYYAAHRDMTSLSGGTLHLFSDWAEVSALARRELSDADVGMVTSYCPDALAATQLVLSSPAQVRAFYDLDTPVTLDCLRAGKEVPYVPAGGLGDFDLVLSYTGGAALEELKLKLGARRAVALYGSVDPLVHRPTPPVDWYRADLSYLGTYAEDRQATLASMFIEPAHRFPQKRFLIGGAQYPAGFPWTENIYFAWHVPPPEHAQFYSSSSLTLNVTRAAMAEMGYCPSGRLFEAAGCGTPVLSDWWEGLDEFFVPGGEILVARNTEEAIQAIQAAPEELQRIGQRARERALDEHTADCRVADLERAIENVSATGPQRETAALLEV